MPGMRHVLALVLFVAGTAGAAASDLQEVASDLQDVLRAAARRVFNELQEERVDTIAVGALVSTPEWNASSGVEMQRVLIDELKAVGLRVDRKAAMMVSGRYKGVNGNFDSDGKFIISEDPDEEFLRRPDVRLALKIDLVLEKQATNQILAKLALAVLDAEEVARLLGISASLAPGDTPAQQSQRLRERARDPRLDLLGTVLRAETGSPYGVELLVGTSALQAFLAEGQAQVKIDPGQSYAVRLVNDADHDAVADLGIDGVNMFTFSEVRENGQPKYSRVVVPRHGSIVVKGWHKTNDASLEFLVTDYEKSAVAQLREIKNEDAIGTITASFRAAWDAKSDPPPDESFNPRSATTGFGKQVEQKYTEVQLVTGALRAVVSVRYSKH